MKIRAELFALVLGPLLLSGPHLQAATNSCYAPPSGLVSWWRADGNADDAVGTNNGILEGGVSYATGEVGEAFVFDGTSGYITIPSSANLAPTGPFTVEAWVNYAMPGANHFIFSKGIDAGGGSSVDWALSVGDDNKLRAHMNIGGHWYVVYCNTALATNTWYHVAMVYDGAAVMGYLNGALDGSYSTSGAVQTTASALKIGAYSAPVGNGPPAYPFAGEIDEPSFYNRALSASELQGIYAAGNEGKCVPPPPNFIYAANGGGQVYEYDTNGNRSLVTSLTVPEGLVLDAGGNLYVAEYYQNALMKITPAGQVSTFATVGLSNPLGLAIDTNGNIYAANFGNNTITEYAPSGQESLFATNGLNQPYGLAMDANDNLFVVNQGNSTITKYSSSGAESLFANTGLNLPGGLALNASGLLFAENGDGTIVEFNGSGVPTLFASPASNPDLNGPHGLAFDQSGNLYVANYYGNNILKFNSVGQDTVFAAGLSAPTFVTVAPAFRVNTNPPSINGQPQPATVYAGTNVSFTVTASGTPPLFYQWSVNNTNISGATNSTFTITNVAQSDLGFYAVVVANAYGPTTSSNALLSLYPYIETPFTGAVTYWGKPAMLSVQGGGTGPLTYQWYDNGAAIANATNATFDLSTVEFTNAGVYSVVIGSPLGSVTNTPEQVVVNPAGVSLGMYPGVTVSGVVGYTYTIQSTSDLANTNGWTTAATITLTEPVQLWVDVNNNSLIATNAQRFYRVLPGP